MYKDTEDEYNKFIWGHIEPLNQEDLKDFSNYYEKIHKPLESDTTVYIDYRDLISNCYIANTIYISYGYIKYVEFHEENQDIYYPFVLKKGDHFEFIKTMRSKFFKLLPHTIIENIGNAYVIRYIPSPELHHYYNSFYNKYLTWCKTRSSKPLYMIDFIRRVIKDNITQTQCIQTPPSDWTESTYNLISKYVANEKNVLSVINPNAVVIYQKTSGNKIIDKEDIQALYKIRLMPVPSTFARNGPMPDEMAKRGESHFKNGTVIYHKPMQYREVLFEIEGNMSKALYFLNDNGKCVIQQMAWKGCTAGTMAMLVLDNKKRLNDYSPLLTTRIDHGTDKVICERINKEGYSTIETKNNRNEDVIKFLSDLLKKNGSCIVVVDGTMGIHSIIVDSVSEEGIRIRDPLYGEDLTVTRDSFLKNVMKGTSVIQIEGGK